MTLALIPIMAFLSRLCGAAWKPKWLPAEMLFAAPFGLVSYYLTGSIGLAVVGAIVTFLGMQTGHGNFWKMRGAEGGDMEHVEYLVREFYDDTTNPLYSWLCFGVKGFLIGLSVLPYGLALIPLWPLAYYTSFRILKTESHVAELLSGGFAGIILWWAL